MLVARPYALLIALILSIAGMTTPTGVHAQAKPPATAQPMPTPVVAVIDFQRVVKESAAGKNVRQLIDARKADFQEEIRKIQQELETARSELSTRSSELSGGEFSTKRQAMRQRVSELQGIIQQRKRELDDMFNAGMGQVDRALVTVLKELAEERGINLILNAGRGRGLVLFAESGIIITEEALQRLNERLPKVELTKPQTGK